jgi:hypothetical protein
MSKVANELRRLSASSGVVVSDPLDHAARTAADLLDEAEKALAALVDLYGDRDADDCLVPAGEQSDAEIEQAMHTLARIRGEQP